MPKDWKSRELPSSVLVVLYCPAPGSLDAPVHRCSKCGRIICIDFDPYALLRAKPAGTLHAMCDWCSVKQLWRYANPAEVRTIKYGEAKRLTEEAEKESTV